MVATMYVQTTVYAVLITSAILIGITTAQRFSDDPDTALWENLVASGNIPPLMSEDDLVMLLNRASSGPDFGTFDSSETSILDDLSFPRLTASQRKFAVNPAYSSYTNPAFREQDDKAEDKPSSNDEVVEDPFESSDKYKIPKKAAMKALIGSGQSVSVSSLEEDRINDIYFTTIVAVSSALAVFAIVGAGFCYHRVQRNAKAAEDVEYPAYGVTGPGKETSPTSGDRKLAQNAQLYHYQHQKQQMIAFDSTTGASDRRNGAMSDNESEDGEEGDYTVYECPGLAPTGEMEVRNPLFEDEPTPKAGSK